MAPISDAEWEAAEARGREQLEREPRAVGVRYDRDARRVVVDLASGCTFTFPVALMQDLQAADDADLAEVRVEGVGFGLHWPSLDVDLYVPALLTGVFGTRAWMTHLARRGGQATSPAKAAAARANGAKGGRPRKQA